jgi:hypothetical protein
VHRLFRTDSTGPLSAPLPFRLELVKIGVEVARTSNRRAPCRPALSSWANPKGLAQRRIHVKVARSRKELRAIPGRSRNWSKNLAVPLGQVIGSGLGEKTREKGSSDDRLGGVKRPEASHIGVAGRSWGGTHQHKPQARICLIPASARRLPPAPRPKLKTGSKFIVAEYCPSHWHLGSYTAGSRGIHYAAFRIPEMLSSPRQSFRAQLLPCEDGRCPYPKQFEYCA